MSESASPAVAPDPSINPYVGPRPFTRSDVEAGRELFGRDWEVDELVNLLIAKRIVLLYAPSGAGKTSLIEAKLITRLKEEEFDVLPTIRVNPERVSLPQNSQYWAKTNPYRLATLLSLEETLPTSERTPILELVDLTLDGYLKRRRQATDSLSQLIIFDQFEEILTLNPAAQEAKAVFFAELSVVLRDPDRWALFSMREDFIAGLDPYLRLLPTRLTTTFRLDLLKRAEALDAIRQPATKFGAKFIDGADEVLVDELRTEQVMGKVTMPQRGQYVEPVVLQVACERLWEKLRGVKRIEKAHLQLIGHVDRALAEFYSEKVQAIAQQTGTSERAIREWFGQHLITSQGLRGQVLREPVCTKDLPNRVIEALVQVHLVRPEQRRGLTWFELAHDRLIVPIVENNTAWMENQLNQFQKQAMLWASQGRSSGAVVGAAALLQAEQWAHTHELTRDERDFLQAARDAHTVLTRKNLADLGWGVIFAYGADPALRDALGELLEHRHRQATAKRSDYYHEFTGIRAYRPGESAYRFMERHGVTSSTSAPQKIPYYLLIVGDPEEIPFEFQYGLDAQYAVGRVYFETLEEYARYARSVVTAEGEGFALPRQAVFFCPEHTVDVAVGERDPDQARLQLVDEIVRKIQPVGQESGWHTPNVVGSQATKTRLQAILGGSETPALLFAACNAQSFAPDDPLQFSDQGALLCANWLRTSRPETRPTSEYYFVANDVRSDARLLGLVVFLVSAYSVGTPQIDDVSDTFAVVPLEALHVVDSASNAVDVGSTTVLLRIGDNDSEKLATRSFLSRLPQRLLAHPQGGALAVIGHVNKVRIKSDAGRAPAISHASPAPDSSAFDAVLARLIEGHTVGSALEVFGRRYTIFSSGLADELQQVVFHGKLPHESSLIDLRDKTVDARNYIIIGDPAVHVPVGVIPTSSDRPVIAPIASHPFADD